MELLQRPDIIPVLLERSDAECCRFGAAQRRHDRCVGIDGSGADFDLIGPRCLASRCVDNELDFAVLQQVKSVWTSLSELKNPFDFQASLFQNSSGASRGNDFKSKTGKSLCETGNFLFVRVTDTDKHAATH